jgi:hypothetical protein
MDRKREVLRLTALKKEEKEEEKQGTD